MTQQPYNIDAQLDTSPNNARVTSGTITPRNWFEQWPIARRSLISNLFHYAVHDGAATPALIINAVQGAIERRLQYVPPPRTATHETLHAVWQALLAAPKETSAYATSVLDWEALPRSERERQKQERGRHFQQQYMAQLPVTPQQQAFLHALGHTGEPPANRAAASTLIDAFLTARRGQR